MPRWEWQLAESDGLAASAIAAAYPPLLARALWARRLRTVEACATWLAPQQQRLGDWQALPELTPAVERIAAAIAAGQPVAVFGDYDVDGITATAIAVLTIQALGGQIIWRLPDRLKEGYGLNETAVRELASRLRHQQPNGRPLLLVLDCGTSNVTEIALAQECGLDVVVLDHHSLPPTLPSTLALVNPRRLDADHDGAHLSAAGLALFLAQGLLATSHCALTQGALEALKRDLVALAALGTVADVAPLLGDNRTLVAKGLLALRRQQRPGLAALIEVAQLNPLEIDTTGIGWRLAPRINAAGRMEHPAPALELLLTSDQATATTLAFQLDWLNQRRQVELNRMVEEALPRAQATARRIPVVAGDDWSPGLVGLVASRLTEELGRPTIVLGNEGALARGSARSIENFNITAALTQCRAHLLRFGGHAQAAGLTMSRDLVPALEEALDAVAAATWPSGVPARCLRLDGDARLDELWPEPVASLARLEPFGNGNPEPLWCIPSVRAIDARRVGHEGRHLMFRVTDSRRTLSCIAFGQGERLAEVAPGGLIDLAGAVRLETWQGQEQVKIHVRDFRPVTATR